MNFKTNFLFRFSLCVCLILGMFACSKKGASLESMTGIVKDIDGTPITGVEVSSNGLSTKTDENGIFYIENIEQVGSRFVLKFGKKGYFDVVRSGECTSTGIMDVTLIKNNVKDVSTSTNFVSSKGAQITVGNMEVNIPKNGLVYEDGTVYNGKVNIDVIYLDPSKPEFQAAMPGGDLLAQREDLSEVPLVSYGMVNVVMKDIKGNKLQLNGDEKSKVVFPIPEKMKAKAPTTMPLWHFNERSGIWEESGLAVRNGDVYEGEVEHFSWVNLDDPKEFVVLHGTVKDANGNILPGVKVTVEQVSAYTKEDGTYSVRIPSETDVEITVKSEDFLNYSPVFSVIVKGQAGGSKYEQDITLPSFPQISGVINNICGKDLVLPLYCTYEVNGKRTNTPFTLSQKDGSFSIKIPNNAQKVSLRINLPDNPIVKEVEFDGSDVRILDGTLQVCYMKLAEREAPHLTYTDGTIEYLELEEADHTDFDKSGEATASSDDWLLNISKYVEDTVTMKGEFTLKKLNFTSGTAQVKKQRLNNQIKISVIASGKVENEKTGTRDAVFEGTLIAPYMYKGKCNDFNKLCWDEAIPTMRTPVTFVEQSITIGMPTHIFVYEKATDMDFRKLLKMTTNVEPLFFNMGYKSANEETYKKIIKLLEDAGYTKEKEDTSFGSCEYSKDGVFVEINYKKGVTYEFRSEGKQKMQMVVQVGTGFEKWIKNLIKKYLNLDWF